MQMIESFVRPIPESTYAHPKEAIFMGVEVAPQSLIAEVVINDAAYELLPKDLKFLASHDYVTNNVLMSVPARDASRHIISPTTFGRTVPVAFGVIPFGDKLGRVITGKGSWVGGDLVQDNMCRVLSLEHPGLLSVAGATDDTKISNLLLAHGFRSALHLGYIVFKESALKSWISNKWKDYKIIYGNISRSFDQLDDLGNPAYLFRIGGSTERQGGGSFTSEKNVDQRKKIDMRQAARLLLMESQIPNSQLFRVMNHNDDWIQRDASTATNALIKLAAGSPISKQEFTEYMHMVFDVYAQNAVALSCLKPRQMLNTRYLGWAKDIDFGLYTYDYDAAEPDFNSSGLTRKQSMQLYIENVASELQLYMDFILNTSAKEIFPMLTKELDFTIYMKIYLHAAGIPQ